jgi:hypothetical protein
MAEVQIFFKRNFLVGCTHWILFQWFVDQAHQIEYCFSDLLPKHIEVNLGKGLSKKQTPCNHFPMCEGGLSKGPSPTLGNLPSLARLTLISHLRPDPGVGIARSSWVW